MMKIYILTDSNGFFGQRLYPWEGLNVNKITDKLQAICEVEHLSFYDIVNNDIDIHDSLVIYSGSQQQEYKEYIEDILIYLMQKGNRLIPSINIFKSHENKGYQELHKKLLNINSLSALYLGTHKEINTDSITFPTVIKLLDGFGSGGVGIVNDVKEITAFSTKNDCIIKRNFLGTFKSFIAKPIKEYFFQQKNIDTGDYYKYFNRFVLQQYVTGLTYDYKVLVLNKKYYALKRFVRKDDFRASGSGNFIFEKVEDGLLNYANDLFNKFNEPMMAFDICFDGNEYKLIEFQGIHFGPYTLINSDGYYFKENNTEWLFVEQKSDLDNEVASAYFNYIQDENT